VSRGIGWLARMSLPPGGMGFPFRFRVSIVVDANTLLEPESCSSEDDGQQQQSPGRSEQHVFVSGWHASCGKSGLLSTSVAAVAQTSDVPTISASLPTTDQLVKCYRDLTTLTNQGDTAELASVSLIEDGKAALRQLKICIACASALAVIKRDIPTEAQAYDEEKLKPKGLCKRDLPIALQDLQLACCLLRYAHSPSGSLLHAVHVLRQSTVSCVGAALACVSACVCMRALANPGLPQDALQQIALRDS
jgi:hypothetical protein